MTKTPGLYYFEARHYDPAIGRFLTADIRLGGTLHRQDATNRYALVLNNPLSFSDPTGHSWYSRAWHSTKKAARRAAHLELKIIETPYVQTVKFAHTNTGKIVLSSIIDASEIGAGVALQFATFGGASTLAGTLMGAGISGLQYTATHTQGNFSWKQYGLAEAEGAVGGLLSGGLGEVGGTLVSQEASFGTQVAAKAAIGAGASATGNVAQQMTTNAIEGHSPFHQFSWLSLGTATTSGAVTGAAGGALGYWWSARMAASAGSDVTMVEMADMQ